VTEGGREGQAPEAPLRVRVPRGSAEGYRVHVAPGALERLGGACRREAPAHRYAVVADATVAGLYGEPALAALEDAGLAADLHTFPPGEASKSRERWARLTDDLLGEGHGRDSAVVALGGGVTGDLAGFVAATYLRGVPVVQVPTTLLAMLDSSVGGKTAVDVPAGKNLVGAFHHPALVVIDPEVLSTLPARQVTAGLAEAVKTAAVADGGLAAWMEERALSLVGGEPEALTELVRRCVAIKARVVEEDPEEAGPRQILNFGHTVAHALEARAGWGLLHGHAVAAGMRAEARLGEALEVTEPGTARRLADLLEACGHRERHESGIAPGELLRAAGSDKKAREGEVRFVLLERVGRVARGPGGAWTHALPLEGVEELLAEALGPARSGR
jgi:3-dehydroquinate synthase